MWWIEKFITQKWVMVILLCAISIISGLGQAIVWVASGEYMSLCATKQTKGFYYGYFWVFYMSSQIFGNYIGAISIDKSSGPFFYLMLGSIMVAAVPAFCFLKIPEHPNDNHSLLDEFFGRTYNDSFYEQLEHVNVNSFGFIIKATCKLITTKKMMKLNLQLFWTGFLIAFTTGILTPLMML